MLNRFLTMSSKQFNGKRTAFSKMMLEQVNTHRQKKINKLQPKPHTLYKNVLNINQGLQCKTVKHLEKKTRENLCDLGLGKEFLDLTPIAQFIMGKTDKLDLIEM